MGVRDGQFQQVRVRAPRDSFCLVVSYELGMGKEVSQKPWVLWPVCGSSLELVPQPFLAPGPICPACSPQKGCAGLVIGNGFRGMIPSANRKNTGPATHNH